MKKFKRLFSLALALVLAVTPIVAQEAAECSAAIHFSGQTGGSDSSSSSGAVSKFTTYTVVMCQNLDGTVTIRATVPEGIYAGKLVITTKEDLQYVEGSLKSVAGAACSENYGGGICVSFASATAYPEETIVLEANYTVKEKAKLTSNSFKAVEWDIFDAEKKLASEEDNDVIVFVVNEYDYGDANGDGVIDAVDAAKILQYDAGLISGDELLLKVADFDQNGVVDAIDASIVLQWDAGMII